MMKKRNYLFSIAMLLLLALFLGACGGTEDADTDGDAEGEDKGETPEFISMLTGGTSGTYYPLGGAMAKIITDETGIQTDAVSSNASADNVIALQEEEAEIAIERKSVVEGQSMNKIGAQNDTRT